MMHTAPVTDMFNNPIAVGSRVVMALPLGASEAVLTLVTVYAIEGLGSEAMLSVTDSNLESRTIRAVSTSFVPRSGAYVEQFLPTGTTFEARMSGLDARHTFRFVWGENNRLFDPVNAAKTSTYPGSIVLESITNVQFPVAD